MYLRAYQGTISLKYYCSYVFRTLHNILNVHFIRLPRRIGSISNIDGAEYHCNKTQVRKVISGVVGAASSVTSIQVANLLRLFRIPQVRYPRDFVRINIAITAAVIKWRHSRRPNGVYTTGLPP